MLVSSFVTTPGPCARRSAADIVTVALDDGTELRLFHKRLAAEQADHPDKRRRDREPLVYRELLSKTDLPVAAAAAKSARLGRRLGRLVAHHGQIADLLASQAPTLVHNDLAPKNVIAD